MCKSKEPKIAKMLLRKTKIGRFEKSDIQDFFFFLTNTVTGNTESGFLMLFFVFLNLQLFNVIEDEKIMNA